MYCHNFFVSEELFSSVQAEGFTVQLLTHERGVDFGLSSANVTIVVDGECVYLVVDHSCTLSMASQACSVYYGNLQWSRHHTQWHSKHVAFTMQKHYACFTKILT